MGLYSLIRKKYYSILREKKRSYLRKLERNGLRLGRNVAIVDTFFFDPSHCFLISIGDNCTLAPGVRLIAHDASTKQFLGYTKIGCITIRENCFLGDSVIVLPGVSIGPSSIIGAGSVVTRTIPEHVVAAGNPARIICSLEQYLEKTASAAENTTVHGAEYSIENINEQRREMLRRAVDGETGFIL